MSSSLRTRPSPLLRRVAEQGRASISLWIDGEPATALHGDTVLTAVLTQAAQLRRHEFSQGPRAGFCLMGACQDCWVAFEDGSRVRACATLVVADMRIITGAVNTALPVATPESAP